MAVQAFDPTLKKYKPVAVLSSKPLSKSLPTLFIEWVTNIRNRDVEASVDYSLTLRMLQHWGVFLISEIVARLSIEKISPKTYKTRLRLLKSFFSWLVRNKVVDNNPLEDVRPRKQTREIKPNRKPFTLDKMRKILEALENDTFLPQCSRYKHSTYYPFVFFIFQMGVRPAEAVGLRVEHIKLESNTVEIKETLARTINGSHSGVRIRKETKNGKQRFLPLDGKLKGILASLIKDKANDALVFTSPMGKAIDDRMFQRRVFRKVLEGLQIEYRVLYASRHSFGSRCIEAGLTPVMTAFLMGNNPETALRNYVH
ncbi:hypothetical protein HY58_03435 [Flavihumibacter sp. ZG627]|nr:hypothetical protein HY58_03435 [Flavihumibacter sp. ZG627]